MNILKSSRLLLSDLSLNHDYIFEKINQHIETKKPKGIPYVNPFSNSFDVKAVSITGMKVKKKNPKPIFYFPPCPTFLFLNNL